MHSHYSHSYNPIFYMGNNPPPPRVKPPTMEETIIQLKMTTKRFQREANKAEKQEKQNITKAKAALKKNSQEGAKMYLMAAASKRNQSLSMQRMAIKMDTLVGTIKSNHNNQVMMGSFNKITNLLAYSQQPNIEVMATDLQRFETQMDKLLINQKIIEDITNKNSLSTDSTAENMMQQLKAQIALEQDKKYEQAQKFAQQQVQKQKDQDFLQRMNQL